MFRVRLGFLSMLVIVRELNLGRHQWYSMPGSHILLAKLLAETLLLQHAY
jgi:hypothetical protein